VPLCGHATLATAHVLFNELGLDSQQVEFDTKSGALQVRRGEPAWLDLPAFDAEPAACPEGLARALGAEPRSVHRARYWICEFADDAALLALAPDFRALAHMDRSIAVTAASRTPGVDFVSRFFAGPVGIDEDPVTGSAHADLAPFWSRRLGKVAMQARQLSRRGGELECRVVGERVQLGGRCVTYSRGQLRLPVH
jgi:predicted PhzF superfamily epimerase YddE/YHI9